jgi:hypothetical protein
LWGYVPNLKFDLYVRPLHDGLSSLETDTTINCLHDCAGSGLVFFHIELPQAETTRWLNISNCGVVVIRKGDITLSELEKEPSNIFCKD